MVGAAPASGLLRSATTATPPARTQSSRSVALLVGQPVLEHQDPRAVAVGRRGVDDIDVGALLAQQQHEPARAVGPPRFGVERRGAGTGAQDQQHDDGDGRDHEHRERDPPAAVGRRGRCRAHWCTISVDHVSDRGAPTRETHRDIGSLAALAHADST